MWIRIRNTAGRRRLRIRTDSMSIQHPVVALMEPNFGRENQNFHENQPKMLIFIPNLAHRHLYQLVLEEKKFGGSFSVKTLEQGSFYFFLQNEGIGLGQSKRAEK
jgi:hypothetical protein